MNNKDYLQEYTIEYPEKSGNKYIFDPFLFGRGAWKILNRNNKPGRYADKTLQKKLNEFFFKRSELPYLYERIKNAGNIEKDKLKNISTAWLQLKIKALRNNIEIPDNDVLKDMSIFSTGGMYLYFYDAKYKQTLPKWDSLPLTIILEKRANGFLGLNLHYLPMDERSVLLGKLLVSNSVYNKSNNSLKININYDNLKKSNNYFKGYDVCIKEYLYSHIRSKILPIDSHEWLYTILLPLENFHYNR